MSVKGIAIACLAVFAPVRTVLVVAMILVVADLITGVIAAWKRGEKITSSGLKQSVFKAFVYEMSILIGYLAEHYLIGDLMPITKIIASLIGITEMLSCVENLNSIYGSPVFQIIIRKLGSKKDEISP